VTSSDDAVEADSVPLSPKESLSAALSEAGQDVDHRDFAVEDAARDALTDDPVVADRLGRLALPAVWLSGMQEQFPPVPITTPWLVYAGEEPGPGHTVRALLDALPARVVSFDPGEDLAGAAAAGVAAVDRAVDEGADLLVLTADGHEVSATAAIAALLHVSAVEIVGDSPHLDDAGWAARVAEVRDRLHETRESYGDPPSVLDVLGDPTLVALTAALLRAAGRRTPCLLDGLAGHSAALLASREVAIASWWWFAGSSSSDVAQTKAQEAIGLEPLSDNQIRLEAGVGGLLALPTLRAAQALAARIGTTTAPEENS
jgi:NaMN:DMB phosphoribosyltransferase